MINYKRENTILRSNIGTENRLSKVIEDSFNNVKVKHKTPGSVVCQRQWTEIEGKKYGNDKFVILREMHVYHENNVPSKLLVCAIHNKMADHMRKFIESKQYTIRHFFKNKEMPEYSETIHQ